jgi:hypothetical protein
VWGARQLLWLERVAGPASDGMELGAALGCIRSFRAGPPRARGVEALRAALDARLLDPELTARLGAAVATSGTTAAELEAEFLRRFPRGVVLDGKRGAIEAGQGRAARTPLALRRLLDDLARLSAGPGRRGMRARSEDVTVLSRGGEPEMVFVLPEGADVETRGAWRRRVEMASLSASIAG